MVRKKFFLNIVSYSILIIIFYASIVKINYQGPENSDKLVHIVMYFFASIAFYFLGFKNYFLYTVIYGVLLEIVQHFLPWRSFSFLDIIANTIGAGLFYFFIKFKKISSS